MLDFKRLTEVNVRRCVNDFGHQLIEGWSTLEWAGAMCGEAGEAANVAKKISRLDKGMGVNKVTDRDRAVLVKKLGGELADTILYCVLTAAREGIDLEAAVIETFNAKSIEIGSKERL